MTGGELLAAHLARNEGTVMESLARVAYEAYAEKTGGKTWDGREMPAWDDLPQQTRDAWDAATQAAVKALKSKAEAAPPVTVHFSGGPWHGKTTDLDRVIGPVFGPGHPVGNRYWLDTKSESGVPTYHWDGGHHGFIREGRWVQA